MWSGGDGDDDDSNDDIYKVLFHKLDTRQTCLLNAYLSGTDLYLIYF